MVGKYQILVKVSSRGCKQESNGLLTANRTPKLDPAAVRAVTSRVSAAVPGDVISQMQKAQDITAIAGPASESASG